MRNRWFAILLVLSVSMVLLAGCGGDSSAGGGGESTETTSSGVSAEPEEEPEPEITLSDAIVLPEGWEISDAISAAEVEAIIGRSDYEYWYESLNDPAAGKPQGSWYDGSLALSKINFLVYTNDGEANFERVSGYVNDAVEVSNPFWDKALLGGMAAGADDMVAILVLRGDVCLRIQFSPEVYAELDFEETSVALAERLINNLYGGERME
jgi:hypothetical protein